MKLYGIINCDTVKKARKQLDAEGVAYTFIDLKTAELDEFMLAEWLIALPDTLVNKRSTTYRTVKTQWLAAESETAQQTALIRANPTLLKRPIIVRDCGEITVGWPLK